MIILCALPVSRRNLHDQDLLIRRSKNEIVILRLSRTIVVHLSIYYNRNAWFGGPCPDFSEPYITLVSTRAATSWRLAATLNSREPEPDSSVSDERKLQILTSTVKRLEGKLLQYYRTLIGNVAENIQTGKMMVDEAKWNLHETLKKLIRVQ